MLSRPDDFGVRSVQLRLNTFVGDDVRREALVDIVAFTLVRRFTPLFLEKKGRPSGGRWRRGSLPATGWRLHGIDRRCHYDEAECDDWCPSTSRGLHDASSRKR
jgi:hypothetical protein